jgi:hypothetical protein
MAPGVLFCLKSGWWAQGAATIARQMRSATQDPPTSTTKISTSSTTCLENSRKPSATHKKKSCTTSRCERDKFALATVKTHRGPTANIVNDMNGIQQRGKLKHKNRANSKNLSQHYFPPLSQHYIVTCILKRGEQTPNNRTKKIMQQTNIFISVYSMFLR